jgi:uncharacterized protein YqjF (DUF2071 family)
MTPQSNIPNPLERGADIAKRRMLSIKGDPFVFADWERVVFLHFAVSPELLRSQLSGPFELELREGRGIVTLVALTMRHFRPARFGPGYAMAPLHDQRFLNLRTYVRWQNEPGALFLWGWISRPFGLPLPSGFGLPFAFATSSYQDNSNKGMLRGEVHRGKDGRFAYHAAIDPNAVAEFSRADSLEAFALERYTGYFNSRSGSSIFRAWHPPWKQVPINATLKDVSLITNRFPWFREARFVGANFAPGFKQVWLGSAHRLDSLHAEAHRHHRLSAFYEMP